MRVVLFGIGHLTSLAWYCLTHDSDHDVVGFTADRDYCDVSTLHELPVVPFDELEREYPPGENCLLIPIGYLDQNRLRARRYQEGKERGYDFVTYISSRASVWPDLTIGENCMIYENTVVQPFARIGNNVIIRSSVHISHHVTIDDHCFIAASASFAGDVSVGPYCTVGTNATVRDRVTLAERNTVGAGAIILRDTKPGGVYSSPPAKRGLST